MIERVIFAGGGTGGHLFPGIAVYEELRRREPEMQSLFVGTARGIESRVVPELGERLVCLDVAPLKGRTPGQLFKNLGALPQAGIACAKIVRGFRPSLVLGVGGYAAGPMVAAAAALGVPTALLEQNAHVGLTNRLLARVVRRAYLTFEQTAALFPARAVRMVGNPVRQSLVAQGRMARVDPAGFEMRARRVLVIGGSQGARALNELVPEALFAAGLGGRGIEVLHQAGRTMCDAVREHYARLGIAATVVPFIDDMAKAYASAALVIGRAGATSIAELCAVGRPSILVPFPAAADDHQWHNARALEAEGAAFAVRESELKPAQLASMVSELLASEDKRLSMAEAARRVGRPDAAAAIVDDLCAFLGCASGSDDGGPEGGDEHSAPEEAAKGRANVRVLRGAFPPDAVQRQEMTRRRQRRRSVAWSRVDSYYGTQAVAALE